MYPKKKAKQKEKEEGIITAEFSTGSKKSVDECFWEGVSKIHGSVEELKIKFQATRSFLQFGGFFSNQNCVQFRKKNFGDDGPQQTEGTRGSFEKKKWSRLSTIRSLYCNTSLLMKLFFNE